MIKKLQSLLRWAFLRAEALFNAAFGDKLNPLYQIGATTFFLFWIVTASGLYLYAFFETSVAGAYSSVEALTHGHLGGIVRSLHRYASDAIVLTMGLHMLRHFAFDRLRGFRWFSWLTGVMLIWLVFASGINGYMLPWDKLAQYVIVSSFEWLDWLPLFDGVLIRNFIYQSSVNDRLFSLLSFIHVAVPLCVLLLMWVHVQRVPKASTNPARSLMVSLTVALLALALFKPALSQGGPADFGLVTERFEFDWFYLLPLPLLALWPLGRVWALLAGGTALLSALPWLPPRFRRGGARGFEVMVRPDGRSVHVREAETLLEAGLRAGIALPYECRNGGCGKCKCTVLAGRVDHGAYQFGALSSAEREAGRALMCCAVPLADAEIEYEPASSAPAEVYEGRVARMELLAEDVMHLVVSLPPGERIEFVAGQYINIQLPGGRQRSFSFANRPDGGAEIDLHVRLVPGGYFTPQVFASMRVGDTLRFTGPFGHFTLHSGEKPIILVAGATGFAPVKSIIEDALHKGCRRPMLLYWGARRPRDLYMRQLAEQWAQRHDNFKFVPVLSEPLPEDAWSGRSGFVHAAILEDLHDLTGCEIYVCGSLKMVQTAVPAFLAQGLAEDACFSDAFLPSADPR